MKKFPVSNLKTNALDTAVKHYVSFPLLHRLYLHSRLYGFLAGSSGILMGLMGIFACLGYMQFAFILAPVVLVLVSFQVLWVLCPCSCGKEYRLTAKTKKVLRQLTRRSIIVEALFGLFIAVLLIFALERICGHMNANIILCILFVVIGFLLLLDSLLGTKLSKLSRAMIPEDRHQRVIAMSGATIEELNEIFQYYLDIGHLDETERISKLSLSLAEGKNIEPNMITKEHETEKRDDQ